jgi:Fe-S-cluster-containing dehydrogenase component
MEHILYADIDRCVGCHACEIACRQEYNVPSGEGCITIVTLESQEDAELQNLYFIPVVSGRCTGCGHLLETAAEPACVSACPTKCIQYAHVSALPWALSQKKSLIILRTYPWDNPPGRGYTITSLASNTKSTSRRQQ